MFGVVPKTIWQKLNPADSNNMCSWAMRCLLAEMGDRLVLIDTGIGNKQSEKFFGFYHLHGTDTLQKSLAALGFTPNDITDVVLTHLHFDHCGGAVLRNGDKLLPAFPHAVYHCHKDHWKWAVHPNPREKASFLSENMLPLLDAGVLNLFATGDQPVPGIDFINVNGHTECMTLPRFSYKGHTVIYMADLIPSMGHIPLPYVMAYDVRPLLTMQEKTSLLKEVASTNGWLFFEHDPLVEMCRVVETEKGYAAGEILRLSDL